MLYDPVLALSVCRIHVFPLFHAASVPVTGTATGSCAQRERSAFFRAPYFRLCQTNRFITEK